jgi:hypothetical protein
MQQNQRQISDLQRLIADWKLNKVSLASKMPMPVPTFKNKINPKQIAYKFTDSEVDRLVEVLREMAADIENICGIQEEEIEAKTENILFELDQFRVKSKFPIQPKISEFYNQTFRNLIRKHFFNVTTEKTAEIKKIHESD